MFRDFFAPVPWSPWSRFRGWFFRSLPLPIRRPALKIHYFTLWFFGLALVRRVLCSFLPGGLVFSLIILWFFL